MVMLSGLILLRSIFLTRRLWCTVLLFLEVFGRVCNALLTFACDGEWCDRNRPLIVAYAPFLNSIKLLAVTCCIVLVFLDCLDWTTLPWRTLLEAVLWTEAINAWVIVAVLVLTGDSIVRFARTILLSWCLSVGAGYNSEVLFSIIILLVYSEPNYSLLWGDCPGKFFAVARLLRRLLS